ncbi:MAG: hypothetical protein KDJ49_08870 [Alphaproteobacteria bacterium]|nr:hypothetical protein [Alphaproteobacteria bacterium]USO07453.1 MAG: hypothetical protein H6866_08575 [Rhodospirillales bacterium]
MLSVQNASFSRTPQGHVRIALDDAAFARADVIFIEPESGEVSGLIGHVHFVIGVAPLPLAQAAMRHEAVILTAPHPLGHDIVLTAPVCTLH